MTNTFNNMEAKGREKELIESFIDYFGVEKILKCIDIDDVMENIDVDDILRNVNDGELIDAMDNASNVLDVLDYDEIVDYLEDRGYVVYKEGEDLSEKSIINRVADICREIKPRGYIDKEEAKRLICDYLDTWMIRHFN